jgi:hypothetical protein
VRATSAIISRLTSSTTHSSAATTEARRCTSATRPISPKKLPAGIRSSTRRSPEGSVRTTSTLPLAST